jgi:hypothetical protein
MVLAPAAFNQSATLCGTQVRHKAVCWRHLLAGTTDFERDLIRERTDAGCKRVMARTVAFDGTDSLSADVAMVESVIGQLSISWLVQVPARCSRGASGRSHSQHQDQKSRKIAVMRLSCG